MIGFKTEHKIIKPFKSTRGVLGIFTTVIVPLSFIICPAFAKSDAIRMKIDFNQSTGSVEFVAIGKPKAIKIHGKGDPPKGQLEISGGTAAGTLTFSLDSLDTGMKLRNNHLKKKYLETDKYPQATFENLKFKLPNNPQSTEYSLEKIPFKGRLTLHGVTRDITGEASVKRSGQSLMIEAGFGIKITAFKIDIPSFAGITVADEVEIMVRTSVPINK